MLPSALMVHGMCFQAASPPSPEASPQVQPLSLNLVPPPSNQHSQVVHPVAFPPKHAPVPAHPYALAPRNGTNGTGGNGSGRGLPSSSRTSVTSSDSLPDMSVRDAMDGLANEDDTSVGRKMLCTAVVDSQGLFVSM